MTLLASRWRTGAVALLLGAAPLGAQSVTIGFDDLVGGNGTAISSTYGTGGNLIASNIGRNTFGSGASNGGLCLWNSGYGDLLKNAYTCNQSAGVSEFTLIPVAGYTLTLNSYLIGEYLGRIAGDAETRVYSLDYSNLLFTGTQALGASGHWTVSPNLATTEGFRIQWGDNWDYGIDDIQLTLTPTVISAVPEPSTVVLMTAGLVMLGTVARRRRA